MVHLTTERVHSAEEAVVWLTDCTLATADSLAMKTRPPKGELDRQTRIAQRGIDWILAMNITPSGRPEDVIKSGGSVADWLARS